MMIKIKVALIDVVSLCYLKSANQNLGEVFILFFIWNVLEICKIIDQIIF